MMYNLFGFKSKVEVARFDLKTLSMLFYDFGSKSNL